MPIDPSVSDVVALGALLVSLIALFGALGGLRRGKPEESYGVFQRLNDLVQKLNTQLTDLEQHVSKEQAAVLLRVGELQQELRNAQDQIADLAQVVLSEAAGEGTEKKTPEVDQFFAKFERAVEPSPLVPPSTPAPVEEMERLPPAAAPPTPPPVSTGLEKTRRTLLGRIRSLFSGGTEIRPEFYEELEELLISSDLGVRTAERLMDRVRLLGNGVDEDILRGELRRILQETLGGREAAPIAPTKRDGKPLIVVVVGVNGVGKTTTVAKLAQKFRAGGARVIVGACDTFRAAAADQLSQWAARIGVEIVAGTDGAKPSTVAYQAIHRAAAEGFDVLILDTAGRLHTRVNLMNELVNLIDLIKREQPGAPHEILLVVDATTGQNALQQAREFHGRVPLTGMVVTKLDGTPKGGIVVAIMEDLKIPIRYIGFGESADSLRVFSPGEFSTALLEDTSPSLSGQPSAPTDARRRRREIVGARSQ